MKNKKKGEQIRKGASMEYLLPERVQKMIYFKEISEEVVWEQYPKKKEKNRKNGKKEKQKKRRKTL